MLEKIIKVLREYKQDESLEVTEASTFDELGFDSLDTVELVMNIEEEFGVSIELEEGIKSVGDLLGIIQAQLLR